MKKASSTGAQLLLTHHPLLFRGVSCIDLNTYPGDVICEAVKNDIAIVAAHTNLDSARTGINHHLAKEIGLTGIEVLEPRELYGEGGYGIGVIGDLPEPSDLLSFSRLIKDLFGLDAAKIIGPDESIVKRIAVVGGSGRDFINTAVEKKADLLITGDIGHHDALTAKTLNISVIDAGHFKTERAALSGFVMNLDKLFENNKMNITIELFDEETDPVRII